MDVFSLQELSFRYPLAAKEALSNVTLQIREGDLVLLMGHSGSGKTTLLKLLKPLLSPKGHRRGAILYRGKPLEELPERTQVAAFGFVAQNPQEQLVTDKVWHELVFGLENLGIDQSTMEVRVAEIVSYFGFEDWYNREVVTLSGGQKQLLNLASALILQPDVLILDEPTAQLDPVAASEFFNTLRKINQDFGTTIILSEHRLEEIYGMADWVVALDEGQVVEQGTPREVAERLSATQSGLYRALPTPVRIASEIEAELRSREEGRELSRGEQCVKFDGDQSGDVSQTQQKSLPLTVREGRLWLAEEVQLYPPRPQQAVPPSAALPPQPLALAAQNLWFRYERTSPDVLRGASLAVSEGEIVALLGGNGSGKSTLLRVLAGVAKTYRGSLTLLGKPLRSWKGADLYHGGVALLPQDPRALMVHDRVRLDLAEMLEGTSLSKEAREQAISAIAARCGITAVLDAHPFDLSGGELQRVALAKVLLCEPRILFLDEPTKGLDSESKEELVHLLNELTAQGVAVLMVSHDVEFCARWAHRVALLFEGEVGNALTPQEFFSSHWFYTTAANRMSRQIFPWAITAEDVVSQWREP